MIVRDFNDILSSGEHFPKVSVIIPLYNYAHMICETLDTLKHQDMRDFALIIVDDKSTDDSLAVAKRWCRENIDYFPRIRLISNKKNGGLSITRNTGISVTTSDYLFFLDADNMLYPRCLGQLARALDESDAAFAFSMLEVFAGRSGVIGTRIFDAALMADGNYIDAMAMIRRSALEKADGYRLMQYGWEDYELWLRFIELGMTGIQVPELLGRYRSHGNSMSNTTTASNSEAVKRQICELHSWVESRPAPEFLPAAITSLWSRSRRYGSLLMRLVRANGFELRELTRMGRLLVRAYRLQGARGVASELRSLDVAQQRRKPYLDPRDVVWLPQFAPVGQDSMTASLPLRFNLQRRPQIGVFLHIFDFDRIDNLKEALSRIPFDFDLYLSTHEDGCKRQVIKSFSTWTKGKVAVKAAPFVQEGFEAAFTLFSPVLSGHDYLLLMHSRTLEGVGGALIDPDNIPGILASFEEDPSIGMVSMAGHSSGSGEPGREEMVTVIARAAMRIDPTSPIAVPADCTAWLRPHVLEAYGGGAFTPDHFRQHGRLGVAMRKLLFLACENAGFNWLVVAPPSQKRVQERPVRTMEDLAQLMRAYPSKDKPV